MVSLIKKMIYAATGILAGAAISSAQTTSNLSIDMAAELTRVGVSPAAASVKGVIVTDTSASWAKGVPQSVKPAYYSLQVTAGTVSSVNHGLKVDYNPIRIPATEVSACNGDGVNCAALEVQTPGGGQATFTLDGNSYLLTTMGPPCESGVTCSFYFTSWHLMNMVREMNGSAPIGFPRVAAVVDSPATVYLMDLERNAVWLTVNKGSLPTTGNIGDLQNVQYDGAGSLSLNFSANRVLLDFVRDRVMLATGDELLIADSALVNMGSTGFTAVVTVPRAGDSSSQILHLSSSAAVWTTHYLVAESVFLVGQLALREAQQPLFATEALGEELFGLSAGGTQGQKWHLVNGLLVAQAAPFVLGGPASEYRLIRGDVWKMTDHAVSLIDLTTGSQVPTSIDNSDVRALLPGQAALRRQVGTNCRYAHLVQHAGSSAAFKDSGLVMSCNSYAGITSSGEAMAMYGQSGTVVQAAYLTK